MARQITIEFLGNSRDLTQAIDSAESRSKRFGGVMGKVGKAIAGGLAIGIGAAAVGLVELTKGAIEDEAAQKKLAQTLKTAAGATDEQVASIEEWISAQGTALGITDDELRPALGKLAAATGDVSEAQKLASLAMDISAGSGKSLESVSAALAKAQNGSVGGLAKYGVATKNAAGETMSLEQIQQKLAKTYKGAASSAADTTAGKMQRLKVILAEAGETIGAKLIPVVTKMADWFLNKGLPAIQQFAEYLQAKVPPIFEKVKAVVLPIVEQIVNGIRSHMGEIKQVFRDVVSIVRSLWARFGSTIVNYTRTSFRNTLQIVSGVFKVIRGVFKTFSALLKGDWKGVWEGIKLILRGALQAIVGVVRQLLNLVKTLWRAGWIAMKAVVSAVWSGIKEGVRNGFSAVIDIIRSIPGRIADLAGRFATAGKGLITAFVNGMKGAGGLVSDIAGNVWSAVKGLLNDAISKINSALEFEISLPGPNININPPNIPYLAKGGIVSKPTLAVIGEDGPEAVVPLGKKNAPRGGISFGGGGDTFNINVYGALDPVAVGKQIEKVLRQYTTSTGRPLQVRTVG